MAFVDRVVQYPGRVKLTPVSGQTNVYDMTRNEGTVTTAGTPLNAANLNSNMQTIAESAAAAPAAKVAYISSIQRGKATITQTAAKTTVSATVTFPHAFAGVPSVSIVPVGTAPANISVSVSAVSTTSFKIYVYRTNKVNTTVYWTAIY